MGFKKQFPGNEKPSWVIDSGKKLLHCMKNWSNVDISSVIQIVEDHNAQFVIEENTGLLMLQFDNQVQFESINKALIELGENDSSKGAELDAPKTIWPYYRESKKA